MNDLLPLLLSAGGAAFITAIFMGIKTLREGKISSEDSIIKRMNEDAKQAHADADFQRERCAALEDEKELFRLERNEANEEVSRLRRILISQGLDPDNRSF